MAIPITRESVLAAVAEYDELGQAAFLAKHSAGPSLAYFLVIDGRDYDSKAIVRAAYLRVTGGQKLKRLSGGISGAATALQDLGFAVEYRPASDVDWTWDEHVLALQLYMRNPASPPGKSSREVIELSELLNKIAMIDDLDRTDKYRNPNGVYMKMMNFRRLDPNFQAQGKKGLSRGAEGEEKVWRRYQDDIEGLKLAAEMIRMGLPTRMFDDPVDEDVDAEGVEGSVLVRTHISRERNAQLIKKKKAQLLKLHGRLACDCCGFDFNAVYGEVGEDFIEIHHTDPIALSKPGRVTKLSELAGVCSNCHRMLHRKGLISIASLRELVGHAAALSVSR